MKRKSVKKKRRQPVPKKNKKAITNNIERIVKKNMIAYGRRLLEIFKNREAIDETVNEYINWIISTFETFDSIQLLGGVCLYSIDNLPTLEKKFLSQYDNKQLQLDEQAECLIEYALNFGLSIPNQFRNSPTKETIEELLDKLRYLFDVYCHLDMPLEHDLSQSIDWWIHLETIAVRGDGYYEHIQQVFKDLFLPHSELLRRLYGFSTLNLLEFLTEVENRVICKIGSPEMMYGSAIMWQRWKKWSEETYGTDIPEESWGKVDFSKGLFGDFFEANPDVPHTKDGSKFIFYPPDDFEHSDSIFWVYPQNETEKRILAALSSKFGDNSGFIKGDYRGNILNGESILSKPFIESDGRYYCFTPMLPSRNLFLIAEKLIQNGDKHYYQKYFQQNTEYNSRDQYIERKVKLVFTSFLSDVDFYPSTKYKIEDNINELDILGVSENANYIIEVKAHELTHKDRVGIIGAKAKFEGSITSACYQCERVATYIRESDNPIFSGIKVSKEKPTYKIVVSFQHHSAILGNMDALISGGLMKEEYRDTWIVSLFDLMTVADFIESELEFIKYLEMHKLVYGKKFIFFDELDLLGGFLNDELFDKIKREKGGMIIGGKESIDAEYEIGIPLNK